MTTYTELLEPTKSEKHGSLIFTPGASDFGHRAGTLTISGTRSFTVYDVDEFPCDHGRGFMLFKTAGGTDPSEQRYAVFCGSDGVGHCECRGFYSTGRCKHLQAIAILVRERKL